jgi:hypothetical protein
MRYSLKGVLAALCGAFFLAAIPASAGPMSIGAPQEIGPSPLVSQVTHFGPPPGKTCIKWTRRFNSAHGFGHRRCIHWK